MPRVWGEVDYGMSKPRKEGSGPPPVTVRLRWPVTVGGEKVSSLTIRPPLARDSRDAQRGGGNAAETEIRLLANLCEVEPAVIEVLQMADYTSLQEGLAGFLAPAPE